jgi:hypothetical protein
VTARSAWILGWMWAGLAGAAFAAPPLTITSGPDYGRWQMGRVEAPITVAGGSGTYSYTVTGSLPPGVVGRSESHPPTWWPAGTSYGLVGVNATPGTYNFTISVNDGTNTVTQNATLTIPGILITDAYEIPNATEGVAYSPRQLHYSTLAPGPSTFSLAPGSSLPSGMALTPAGVLQGTPAAGTRGMYYFTAVLDQNSETTQRNFNMVVLPYSITNQQIQILNSAVVNQQFTTTPAAALNWYVSGGSLPNGLSLSAGGLLSGTIASTGTWWFQLSANDATGLAAQQNFAIHYRPGPTASSLIAITGPNTLDAITVGGQWWQGSFSASNGVMGPSGYSWAITSGSLPPGMFLATGALMPQSCCSTSPVGALLSGLPRQTGTFNFTLTATDSSTPPVSVSQNYTLNVVALDTDWQWTPAAVRNFPGYNGYLRILGGTAPYSVTLAPGSQPLPSGATLNADGSITGQIYEGGLFYPSVRIQDSSAVPIVMRQHSQNLVVNSDIGGVFQISIDPTPAYVAVRNQSYSFPLRAYGGSGNYQWRTQNGSLPPGLFLSTSGPSATANIVGTPTVAGTYAFDIVATDNANLSYYAFKHYMLTVTNLGLTGNGTLPFGNIGTAYSANLQVTGAVGTVTWALGPGQVLPPGLTLSSAGALTGMPSSTGQFYFTAVATDSSVTGSSVTYYFNVSIYPAGQAPPLTWTSGPDYGVWNSGVAKIPLTATGGRPPYTFSFAPGGSLANFRVQNGQPLPAGFSSSAGLVGVALSTGPKTFTLRVTDADGRTADQSASVIFGPIGAMMPSPLPYATNGVSYSRQLLVDGAAGYTFQPNGTLPAGMSLSASGVLSGTPAAGSGSFNVPFKLVDASNNYIGSWNYTLPVQVIAISWPGAPGVLPNGTVGIAYGNKTLTATGGSGTGYVWSINNGGPPGGMSLSTTGVISGTPTGYTNSVFQVKVTDSVGNSALAWIQLSVVPAGPVAPVITTTSFSSFPVGVYNWYQVSIAGGTAPYTVSADTPLPAGLSLVQNLPGRDTVPGMWYLQGRTLAAPGTYPITLRVTDSFNNQAAQSYSLVVSPLWLDTNSLPDRGALTYGTPFSQPLLILGGSGTYTVTATQPMLGGLSVSSGGTVSGTPVSTGLVNTLLSIVDAADATKTLVQNLQVTANASSPVTLSINNGPDLGTFAAGGLFTNTLTATGSNANPPNYVFTLEPGSTLPPGVSILSGNSLPSGFGGTAYVLGGECTTPGNYTFTIRVTDANGNFGLKQLTIHFSGNTLLSSTALPTASLNVPYSTQIYSGNVSGSITYTLAAGSGMPPGLTLSSSGLVTGTPTSNGLFPFTVLIGDGVSPALSRTFSVRVQGINITSPDTVVYTIGTPSPFTFTQTGAAGPVTWSWTSSNPFCGLTLNTSTGAVTGTPASCTGMFGVTVTASDGTNTMTQNVAFLFHTAVSTLGITSAFILDASAGQSYGTTFGASGGVGPYTWSLAPGSSLPPGLRLVSTSQALKALSVFPGFAYVYGVPTTPGNYTFTLQATDTGVPQQTAAMTYTMTVSPVVWQQSNPRVGTYGAAYSQLLAAYSPNGPVTCSLAYGFLPAGLTLSNGCLLSGTPTDTGTFTLGIQMSDGSPYPIVKRVFLTINATSTTTLTLGTSYPIDGSVGAVQSARTLSVFGGTAPYTFTLQPGSQLPPGMAFASLSNLYGIGNAPTAPGLYSFTVRVNDSMGSPNFGQRTYKFNVSPMQLPLGTTFLQTVARVGQAFNYTLPIAGGTPPYSFTVLPAGSSPTGFGNSPMPPGVSLAANGQITGTPTGTGQFTPVIRVTDSAGASLLFQPTIIVSMPGVPFAISASTAITINASAGVPASFPLDANPLPGGGFWYVLANGQVTWALHAGSVLPAGVSLVTGSGNSPYYLAGTPAAAGTYNFSLDLTDASGQVVTKAVTLVVSALSATPNTLPGGTVGTPYSAVMTASGGTGPYSFTAVGLPPGLSITPAGTISGMPTYAGRFQGTITITDSTAGTPNTLNRPFTIVIAGTGAVIPQLMASPQTLQVSYQQGDPLPGPIPLNAGSSTGTAIPFTASTATLQGSNWLSISSPSGTAPASLTITVNPTGLIPGVYNGIATLTGSQPDNGTASVPVTLTVSAPAPCSYALTPGSGTIGAAGGTLNIGVATGAQCSWSASTPAGYVTFQSGGSGTGNGTVVVNVAANGTANQRIAIITAGGQSYTLTQFGQSCSFTVSPGLISIPAGGGGVLANLNASANSCAWTAQSNAAFVTLDAGVPASGSGSQAFSMTVAANSGAAARQGTVTLGGQTLTINQDGVNCTTSLGLSSANVTYSGGAVTVPVTATCSFNITPGPSWITVAGTTPTTVNLTIAPNSSTQARSGSIQIGGLPFQVIEDGVPCSFSLGNNNPVIGSSGGNGSVTITASSGTCGWVASSNASFLGITSAPSGTGSGILTFSVGPNASQTGRAGTISIAGQNVMITQGGLVCGYDLQSSAATVNGLGGTGVASVITAPGCSYTAQSNAPWINVTSGATGSGSGDVGFTAAANPSAAARSGTLTIAGKTFTVAQGGMPCGYTLGTPAASLPTGGGSGSFTIQTPTSGCSPKVQSFAGWLNSSLIFDANAGTGTVSFTAQSNPTPAVRTGTISVDDQTFTVNVAASPCSYTLGSSGATFGRLGGTSFAQYSASPPACTPTLSAPAGITLLGTTTDAVSGQDVNYSVSPYQVFVNWVRTMQINVSGNLFTVKQTSW